MGCDMHDPQRRTGGGSKLLSPHANFSTNFFQYRVEYITPADVQNLWCAVRSTSVYSYKVVLEERAVKPVHPPRKRCHLSVPRCCCNKTRSTMASVSLQVKEVCTRGHKMVVAKRSDTIEMCVKKMIAADVRHLPVIDDHTGEVFGLISVKVRNRRTLLHTASASPASIFREMPPVPPFRTLFVWCVLSVRKLIGGVACGDVGALLYTGGRAYDSPRRTIAVMPLGVQLVRFSLSLPTLARLLRLSYCMREYRRVTCFFFLFFFRLLSLPALLFVKCRL